MTENQTDSVAAPILKIATAWAAVGITSWADFASFLAAFYTMLLICEWLWKKFKWLFVSDEVKAQNVDPE